MGYLARHSSNSRIIYSFILDLDLWPEDILYFDNNNNNNNNDNNNNNNNNNDDDDDDDDFI